MRLDAKELKLRDSKTGPRTVSLSAEAADVLAALERVPANPWVIPGTRPGQRLSSIFEPWRRVRARAGLDDVRIHDLRHSYASRALALGESLPVIAKLAGPRPDPDHRPLHPPHPRRRQGTPQHASQTISPRDIFPTNAAPPTTPIGGGERHGAGLNARGWEPLSRRVRHRLDAGGRILRNALMPTETRRLRPAGGTRRAGLPPCRAAGDRAFMG